MPAGLTKVGKDACPDANWQVLPEIALSSCPESATEPHYEVGPHLQICLEPSQGSISVRQTMCRTLQGS